jgi:hypothetical protein
MAGHPMLSLVWSVTHHQIVNKFAELAMRPFLATIEK